MKNCLLITLIFLGQISVSFAQKVVLNTDSNGENYKSYTNDPSNSRWYTLDNGLTVILAKNSEKPRVQTLIATKAGSSSDPAENTGLAHYLEHMLFKGTDQYGTLDFSKEKVYLDRIDELYEKYNTTTDEDQRKIIYAEIDSVSGEAAKYGIANEYDKLLQGIGAKGTNAFTSFEQTVYVNDLPSNQIKAWIDIEAERFRKPVLRLFHTELEAVYEEKNRSIDNDNSQVYEKLLAMAFPNHNYGRQTTIGTIEHLKNPSLVKIREYYDTYYVPNNMAIIMVGDMNLDETFQDVKKNFTYMQQKPIPGRVESRFMPLKESKKIEITGPSRESVVIGYNVPDALSEDAALIELVDLILANSSAGLIDLNMVKAQKCLSAYSAPMLLKERGLHYFSGTPLEGQSLEDLESLFYEQLELLKSGEFDMSLLKSIVLNQKVQNIRQFESYRVTAYTLLNSFVLDGNWSQELDKLNKMLSYSKKDIVNFANKYYGDGKIVIYKRQGEKPDMVKVEKPKITKVEVNRGKASPFVEEVLSRETQPITPQVLNYKSEIEFDELNSSIPIWKVKNSDNQLFTLYYVLDIGSRHDQKLALAVEYLKFLGTEKYTSEEISTEFYKLACNYGVSTGAEQSYVYLSGLASNFDEALNLFEHLLQDAKADDNKLDQLIAQKLKKRQDAKLSKNGIMYRLRTYALYGENNPAKYMLNEEELNNIKGKELASYIHNLTSYKHKIWYNGPLTMSELKQKLDKVHKSASTVIATPELKVFEKQPTGGKLYFAHYDMVQAEVAWVKKSTEFDVNESAVVSAYNEYFGGGMSGIVFQEIRESKALAYSTYSVYSQAGKLGEDNSVMAYVGTQADKMQEAVVGMNELLTSIPQDQTKFNNAIVALEQGLATSRILKMGILFDYNNAQKLNIDKDRRVMKREQLKKVGLSDIVDFHTKRIVGNYNYAVLGDREKIDLDYLNKLGSVEELTLEQLFGY